MPRPPPNRGLQHSALSTGLPGVMGQLGRMQQLLRRREPEPGRHGRKTACEWWCAMPSPHADEGMQHLELCVGEGSLPSLPSGGRGDGMKRVCRVVF